MEKVERFTRTWSARLGDDQLALTAVDVLWDMRESFAATIIERARLEGPLIDTVIAGDLEETRAHVLQHFRSLLALPVARGRDLGQDPMAFIRRHGVRRAQGGVPLLAVLQAYRTGHKSFWQAACAVLDKLGGEDAVRVRTAMLLSEYLTDYTDLISIVVTEAYLEEQSKLAEQRTWLGLSVLEDLLKGTQPRADEGWVLCEESGLTFDTPMAVIVAQSRGAAGGSRTRDVGALARALELALPRQRFGRIVGMRGDEAVAIVSAMCPVGRQLLSCLRTTPPAFDPGVRDFRIGIGLDVASVSGLPRGYREALVAIRLSASSCSVNCLEDFGLSAYLLGSADDTAHELARALSPALLNGDLARTLEAFAAADLNIKACARTLGVHTNTIYHRLDRIRRMTGINPRTFRGLSDLSASMMLSRDPE